MAMSSSSSKVDDPENQGSFSYYQVKEPATVKQIAASKDVYGDPGMWRVLINANREKIADEKAIIPKGTLLIVPNLMVVRDYDFGDGEN